jgi:hypothetical protein
MVRRPAQPPFETAQPPSIETAGAAFDLDAVYRVSNAALIRHAGLSGMMQRC